MSEVRFGSRDETRTLAGVEALEALYDPLRFAITQRLDEPKTVSEVARELAVKANGLHYHFRILERHGVIEHVDTRTVGAKRERRFVRTADRFATTTEAETAVAVVTTTRQLSLIASFRRFASAMGAPRQKGDVRGHTDVVGRLSHRRARELQRRIDATVQEFFAEPAPANSQTTYALLAVLTPMTEVDS